MPELRSRWEWPEWRRQLPLRRPMWRPLPLPRDVPPLGAPGVVLGCNSSSCTIISSSSPSSRNQYHNDEPTVRGIATAVQVDVRTPSWEFHPSGSGPLRGGSPSSLPRWYRRGQGHIGLPLRRTDKASPFKTIPAMEVMATPVPRPRAVVWVPLLVSQTVPLTLPKQLGCLANITTTLVITIATSISLLLLLLLLLVLDLLPLPQVPSISPEEQGRPILLPAEGKTGPQLMAAVKAPE